jgi:hypothetical protein
MTPLIAVLSVVSSIHLYPGYVTKVECEGKLLVSAIGNDRAVMLAALPKELGCGVLLKPLATSGRTNLILETSTGTVERVVEVSSPTKVSPTTRELFYQVNGGKP